MTPVASSTKRNMASSVVGTSTAPTGEPSVAYSWTSGPGRAHSRDLCREERRDLVGRVATAERRRLE